MFLIPLNISELTTSQICFETVLLPGSAAIIFPKCGWNQKWKIFTLKKAFVTPNFRCRNFSGMYQFWVWIFWSSRITLQCFTLIPSRFGFYDMIWTTKNDLKSCANISGFRLQTDINCIFQMRYCGLLWPNSVRNYSWSKLVVPKFVLVSRYEQRFFASL